jgi:hypothetical protein
VSSFGLEIAQGSYCELFWVRGEVHFVLGACHSVLLRIYSSVKGGWHLISSAGEETAQDTHNTVNQLKGREECVAIWIGLAEKRARRVLWRYVSSVSALVAL